MLGKARESAGTARVVTKSAKLEWALQNLDEADQLLNEGIQKYPDNPKLWMMRGQMREQKGELGEAVQAYMEGLRKCPQSVPLWILCTLVQKNQGDYTRAR